MTIWITGSEHTELELMQLDLKRALGACSIVVFETEFEFRVQLVEVVSGQHPAPDIILLSLNLRWCWPSPDMHLAPSEIIKERNRRGNFATGFRLRRLLLNTGPTRNIPVIVYGVLTLQELPDAPELQILRTKYFETSTDSVGKLPELIREMLAVPQLKS